MITHRQKIRRQLRSARVAALTPEERSEELRAAEARCAARRARSEHADVHPAGATGREANDAAPSSHGF
jgi:hypothetical protein